MGGQWDGGVPADLAGLDRPPRGAAIDPGGGQPVDLTGAVEADVEDAERAGRGVAAEVGADTGLGTLFVPGPDRPDVVPSGFEPVAALGGVEHQLDILG